MFHEAAGNAVLAVCLVVAFFGVAGAAPSELTVPVPDYGSGDGGTAVTLQGKGLGVVGGTRVVFGDTDAADVLVADAGGGNFTLTCTTPAHCGGLCDVTVINPDLSSGTLPESFVFVPKTFDPAVTGALPCASPTTGGRTVFVAGQQAGLPFGTYTLTVGGVPITNVREYVVPGCIPLYSGVSPAHGAGLFGFGVVGYGELMPNCFIYSDSPGPVLLKCSPVGDWDTGGAEVHIVAANLSLTGVPVVTFGGVAAANVVVHPDFGGYITCTAPPHAAGLVDLVVTNPDTQSGALAGAFTYNATHTPVPLSVSPNQGPGFRTNYATITGTGFSALGTTQVAFGGVPATGVYVSSDTTLGCYTPLHDAGIVDITVTNPGGTAGTLAGGYTFLPPTTPIPTAIAPNSGQEAGGTRVTITGTQFSTTGGVSVTFGDKTVSYVSVVDLGDGTCRISCLTPAHAPGTVDVMVTNPGNATGTLVGGFTYLPQQPPTVGSVSPAEGTSLGGTEVTVTGTGFNIATYNEVRFGGVSATNVYVSDDRTLTCTTPMHLPGAVDVTVASSGLTGTLSGGYTYLDAPAPSLVSLSETEGPGIGGQLITISGSGFSYPFSSGTRVLFGNVETSDSNVYSTTSLVCTTPPGLPGVVDVVVVNPDGKTGVLAGAFTYLDAPEPVISTLSPVRGLSIGGTTVYISGTGFAYSSSYPAKILFGGVEAPDVQMNGGLNLSCHTPPHAAGIVDVVVVNPDGKTATVSNGFSYLDTIVPTIVEVSPAQGYATGDARVVIRGADFSEGTVPRVTFGGVDATEISVSNRGTEAYIYCLTPLHSPGVVDIQITNPGGGAATLVKGFTYVLGPPPGIEKVVLADGPSVGGTPVFMSGWGFGKLGTTRVTFGSVDATEVTVLSRNDIFCIVPPHAAGTVDVTVLGPDGQTGTLRNAFTYHSPSATIVRVDADNVSGVEDGVAWETAFSSIQAGIDAVKATGESGEVWVAEGNYLDTGSVIVAMEPFCDVFGGFAGNESLREERNIAAHICTIDGDNARACVYGADNARLDGFTITRGNGPAREGMNGNLSVFSSLGYTTAEINHILTIDNSGVSPTIANCVITGNSPGFAVMLNLTEYNKSSSPLIIGCMFTENPGHAYAMLNGDTVGAVSRARVMDSAFAANYVGIGNLAYMGGPCLSTISRCSFTANTFAGFQTISMLALCRARVENCIFTQHKRHLLDIENPYGGSASVDLVNCTIADNPVTSELVSAHSGGLNMTNCVVWNNGCKLPAQNPYVSAAYCDVEGGYAGTGNIDADPLFADAAAGDFRLQPGSPCVDTATADGAPSEDLLGVFRPQRGGYDMGAYELPAPVPVPDVVGQEREAAIQTLAGGGFGVGVVTQEYSLIVSAGAVISQNPAAGTSVQPGSTVDLAMSRGGIAVPDTAGQTQGAAGELLTGAGLALGTVTEEYSLTVTAGVVISQSPAAGIQVLPAAPIALVVSRGGIIVPDVLAQPQGNAAAALAMAGLAVGAVAQQYSAAVPSGMVLTQTPAAGTSVLPSTVVDLTVSLGTQPSVMPDVLGQPQAQAGSAISGADLVLGAVTLIHSAVVPLGSVAAQSPAAGVGLPPGTVVGIVVSLGPAPAAEGEREPVTVTAQQLAAAVSDANGDGRLSFEEVSAAVPGLTQDVFDEFDTDGDGQLDTAELGSDEYSGCSGCRDGKSGAGCPGLGKLLSDLFLTGLGLTGMAVLSISRHP